MLKACTCHGKVWCIRCFWITASFPLEHGLFKYAPGFRHVGKLFGM